MLNEAWQLVTEDQLDSADRAVISAFYNGRQTMSDGEAEERGVTELVNHLFGYDSMATAKSAIEGIFMKPPAVWQIKLPGVPSQIRQKWEIAVTKNFNSVIKRSGRLKPQIKTLAGDTVLFGSAFPIHRDDRDWCPKVMRPLVPRGTPTLPESVPYAVVPSHLTLGELVQINEGRKKAGKSGGKSYWKADSLTAAIDTLKGNVSKSGMIMSDGRMQADEIEQDYQENKWLNVSYRTKLPVYYVYTARHDEPGVPADLTILARYTPIQQNQAAKASFDLPVCLYERDHYFEKARNWLNPFFMDASLDGEQTWHRVMGLGRLNFDSDVDVEEFFNEAMQGSKENLRRIFQVDQQGDWEMVKRWNDGEFASNVLPPGVKLAEMAKNPNFQYAQQTLAMLKANSKNNAGSSYGVPEDRKNELQVNAIERQGRNAETIAARMSDIYDNFDMLGTEMFRRLCLIEPLPIDPGYAEVEEFQERCRIDGVPVEVLRQLLEGGSYACCIETNRSVGDGNKVRSMMVNQMLMQRLSLFSPESQQVILRRVTADETQDYGLAEELVPYERTPDANQVERANSENNAMVLRCLDGYVSPHNKDDLDPIHLVEHFGGLKGLIAKGNTEQGWDQMDAAAFKCIGSHCALHINIIKNNPEEKALATALMQQLQSLAKQGQEFLSNLQKKMQSQQQQVDPVEQAKLQMQQEKLGLDVQKQQDLVQHRKAQLALATRRAGSAETIAAAQLIGSERQRQHKAHVDRVKLAQDHIDRAHELLKDNRDFTYDVADLQQKQQQFDSQQEYNRQQSDLDRQYQQDQAPAPSEQPA